MNDQTDRDARVTRETVGHLHTLAIEQRKRISEIERHVRDIKFFVAWLLIAAISAALVYQVSRRHQAPSVGAKSAGFHDYAAEIEAELARDRSNHKPGMFDDLIPANARK